MSSANRQIVRAAHPLVRGLANEKQAARLEYSIHLTNGDPSRFRIQLINHVEAGDQIKLVIAKWESVRQSQAGGIDPSQVPQFGGFRGTVYTECMARL